MREVIEGCFETTLSRIKGIFCGFYRCLDYILLPPVCARIHIAGPGKLMDLLAFVFYPQNKCQWRA